MDKKQIILIFGTILVFGYLAATSLVENKHFCRQDKDCSLVETSCCVGEKTYSCFESNYALLVKFKNLKCPLLSNGSCASEFKLPPDCVCVRSSCELKEKNDTAFQEQLKNLSYEPIEEESWGR